MKRKRLTIPAVILGVLALLISLIWSASSLWAGGFEPFCIQGSWLNIKFVPCAEAAIAQQTVTPLPLPTPTLSSPTHALPSPTPSYATNCAQDRPALPNDTPNSVTTVTYLANSGFLITSGEQKILIDGLPITSILIAELPDVSVQNLLNARPPFDEIDLILVTHSHWDHFSAENTISHLKNNPCASLVATEEVVQAVLSADDTLSSRLIPINLRHHECQSKAINGIGVQILQLSHGRSAGVENLGFIITVNNVRLFHSGDMEPDAVWLSTLQSYSLPELNLDVAILPEFMFTESTYHKRITEGVRATHFIPMHFAGSPAAQIIDEFPQAVLFKHSLETWSLP